MINDDIYETFLTHLLDGDRAGCAGITENLISAGVPVKELYTGLFQRSLYRVGELWEFNRIPVSVEHMATAIIEGLFTLVYPMIFRAEHSGRKAVVSCVANEYHQVGGKMVADIFELNGWDGFFLGANMPVEELIKFIDDKKPEVLALSLSIFFHMKILQETIERVRANFRDLDIIVGGQAFRHGGSVTVSKFRGVTYVDSIHRLENMIKGV